MSKSNMFKLAHDKTKNFLLENNCDYKIIFSYYLKRLIYVNKLKTDWSY
jgi:hypothetical protein